MEEEAQRVVVVMDASRDVSPSAIKGILKGLSLKPGDALKFIGVLHQIKVDSRSMFGTNQKIIMEEKSKKREEYYKNEEIMNIKRQCETEKIEFHVEVRAGPSLKMIAVKAVKKFNATSVILDRHIKKDKRYFLEKLSCRILRMKRDNSVEQLRGPKPESGNTKSQDDAHLVTYDEMIPEMISATPRTAFSPKNSQNPDKTNLVEEQGCEDRGEPPWQNNGKSSFSKSSSGEQLSTMTTASNTEASRRSVSAIHLQEEEEYLISFAKEIVDDQENADQNKSLGEIYSTKTPDEKRGLIMGWSPKYEEFQNSSCSHCGNTRPKIRCRRDFSYAELHGATKGFSGENYLSEGGFGSVYKGEIDGVKIAVKQHKNASHQGEKEFKSEVQVLTKARHENLVMLLGSCAEGSHRLLVYEYVCNGSLDQHLPKHARVVLSWENRLNIAVGAAKALQYLHENNIIHRDMRPNNILVTHDYEPLLGDFGLARTTQCGDSDNSSETRVVGTLGYLAPEYAEYGRVSTKTDVYSFGVVLLQLITGLKTTDKKLEEKSLVGWARPLLKEKNYPDLIDPRIPDLHEVHQLLWMVRLVEKCLSKDPEKRPTMDGVVEALNFIIKGVATCNIRGLSPAPSDSGSSLADSSDSPSQPEDDETFSVESTSISSGSSSSQMSFITRHPPTPPMRLASQIFYPSPPLQSHAVSSPRSSEKYHNKKREKSRGVAVLYGEMMD
ncbi:hypothetical protein Patl1_05756 [Pistacia atlantica]|uniref:Uncharacterized protein n=1 Tax=Pistacia atlantica TaxID=434234 RepID=A0ACC1BNN0_9ROSI|nr:hypothetical protein Patl1_05756 [Pistacia atlantica]